MSYLLRALLFVLCALPCFGVAATTTLTYTNGDIVNIPTNAAVNSTENIVVVTVTPGHPVTVEFTSTTAWYYRRTIGVATNDKPIAAGTPERLRFTVTTTFYHLRQASDGTMSCMALLLE